MSERLSKAQLDKIMKDNGVTTLWSWSRYKVAREDKYTYLLKYILHTPPERFNTIYGIAGNHAHDIIQNFYDGKIKYEDMIEEYEQKLLEMNLAELKYNRKSEEKNEKIAEKYEANIRLFFRNHIPIPYKAKTEQFILIKTKENLFQGYVDFTFKDNEGCYNIIDWKSSTIYQGVKVKKERGQLLLYAEAIHQLGIPYERIKIGWNFLKYCTVTMTTAVIDKETKLNKVKTKNTLRSEWVKSVAAEIKRWLKKLDYTELEIEDLVYEACVNNNLDNIPGEIQEKFKLSDCYVYIPYEKEDIEELITDIDDTIRDIAAKTEEFKKTGNDRIFWTTIDSSNEYYFHNLCDYGRKSHRPYDEYLKTLEMFLDDENKDDDDNDDWLSSL